MFGIKTTKVDRKFVLNYINYLTYFFLFHNSMTPLFQHRFSFYRCSEKGGCFGRIKALDNGTYLMTNGHNGHANKAAEIEKYAVVNEMLVRARDTSQPMRSIFEAVREA